MPLSIIQEINMIYFILWTNIPFSIHYFTGHIGNNNRNLDNGSSIEVQGKECIGHMENSQIHCAWVWMCIYVCVMCAHVCACACMHVYVCMCVAMAFLNAALWPTISFVATVALQGHFDCISCPAPRCRWPTVIAMKNPPSFHFPFDMCVNVCGSLFVVLVKLHKIVFRFVSSSLEMWI